MRLALLLFSQELGFPPETDPELLHHHLPAFCAIGRVVVHGGEEFG
jgi:hypothetical protein